MNTDCRNKRYIAAGIRVEILTRNCEVLLLIDILCHIDIVPL